MATVDAVRSISHTSIHAGSIFVADEKRSTARVGMSEVVVFDQAELFEIGSTRRSEEEIENGIDDDLSYKRS